MKQVLWKWEVALFIFFFSIFFLDIQIVLLSQLDFTEKDSLITLVIADLIASNQNTTTTAGVCERVSFGSGFLFG